MKQFSNYRLGKRLLIWILAVSSVTTTAFTAIAFWLDYVSEMSVLDQTLHGIQTSTIPSLEESLYNLDQEMVQTIGKGVLGISAIQEITITHSTGEVAFAEGKENPSDRFFAQFRVQNEFPLYFGEPKEKIGLATVVVSKGAIYKRLIDKALVFFLTQGLKTIIVSTLILIIFYLLVTRHLNRISDYIQSYSRDRDSSSPPLSLERSEKYQDELSLLVSELNHSNKISQELESIKLENLRLEIQKVKMQSSFDAAKVIQQATFERPPPLEYVKINSLYLPAENVGGDWYSYFYDEKNRNFFTFIGDVTGHGLPSAMITAVVAGAIKLAMNYLSRLQSLTCKDVLELLAQELNRVVYYYSQVTSRYMTMAFVGFNIETGEGYYLNAGHRPVLVHDHDMVHSLLIPGDPLGRVPNGTFGQREFRLSPGDYLFLFTDGLIENHINTNLAIKSRFIRRILTNPDFDQTSETFCKLVTERFGSSNIDDDICLLFIQWVKELPSQKAA
ncbi:PP2C family protein-serine/threonine phosphatase [Pseudobacteriovorax antillogorgiicola]|uniref:Serine phosphatase RsbU, regulator of sigma subunit n=1 Tax=Pseudobacteriovorax antillogorgiicola TaxID=1513793 RepID=A0A1Y6CG87_9BACT|nr:SpoIIE family protein phosphatase [Pseudobacteriovorax antillogorgiicola]TCS48976.1 serine phosphatase RsbU (regulator of sigma subunit) [Pseudobacteriovorax antillogorgiicola]SMF53539.1 Serine phosphatase RsbU, regulator of sigma subunit [Pseudobacteriovorax antillogorgiicola]